MATTGKVLCRYFMSGCCKNGSLCPFSHQWTDKPDMTCKFYLMGQCSYGDKCRYDHVKLPKEPKHKKSSTNSSLATLPSLSQSPWGTGESRMVTLTKDPSHNPRQWAQAAEFVPGKGFHGPQDETLTPPDYFPDAPPLSYSNIASGGGDSSDYLDVISTEEAAGLLCPFAEMGKCPFEQNCEYLHGDLCDMCNRECLNPYDPDQQKAHKKACLEMHEIEMERAFQIQETAGKKCAICLENVSEKAVRSDRRFGILPNCEHCFCLACIRKWRQTTHTQQRTIRACPLCRTVSYFVIPSEMWMDDVEQKSRLVAEYTGNLSKKHCKYFDMGKGTCSFGTSCFYKHEYPDGTEAVDVPRYLTDAEGDRKPVKRNTLWEFLSEREDRPFATPRSVEELPNDSELGHTHPVMEPEEVWSDLSNEPLPDNLEDII